MKMDGGGELPDMIMDGGEHAGEDISWMNEPVCSSKKPQRRGTLKRFVERAASAIRIRSKNTK